MVQNANDATLYIYDEIGPAWMGLIDAIDVAMALKQIGDVPEISVRINSPGGDVFQAAAIFNHLRQNSAQIAVKIDGVAASAASIIAMAGDTIEISQNGMIMIHQASTIAIGNQAEMIKTAELLGKVDGTMIDTYVQRTGNDAAKIKGWVEAETWFTADEAVTNGFADSKVGAVENVKMQVPKGRYKNTPKTIQQYDRPSPIVTLVKPPERPELKSRGYSPGVVAARVAALRASL